MPDKKLVTVVAVGILILLLLGFVFTRYNKSYNKSSEDSQKPSISTPTSTPTSTRTANPSSSVASKPALVTISTVQGTITSLASSSVTINSENQTKTFSISATKDFQKVTSGTVAGGDVKTVPSSTTELKVNQQILIIYEVKSTNAKAIYILK